MATPTTNPPSNPSGWDELRRAADQLELELHLGSMELRDRWRAFVPRLEALEHAIAAAGGRAGHAIATEITELRELIRGLRHGLDHPDP